MYVSSHCAKYVLYQCYCFPFHVDYSKNPLTRGFSLTLHSLMYKGVLMYKSVHLHVIPLCSMLMCNSTWQPSRFFVFFLMYSSVDEVLVMSKYPQGPLRPDFQCVFVQEFSRAATPGLPLCLRPRVHKSRDTWTSNVFSSKSSQGRPRPDHQCVFSSKSPQGP